MERFFKLIFFFFLLFGPHNRGGPQVTLNKTTDPQTKFCMKPIKPTVKILE